MVFREMELYFLGRVSLYGHVLVYNLHFCVSVSWVLVNEKPFYS